ncbi:hypothetical protein FKG94_03835 [Exilibacterium tricleocarpae]|uniref:Uncharacterized protein n=1 Tax=Exilibacterium tricleocarpae TaxID=2591008 RepID=A0A545U5I3_9GAMM|nr:hypothetical protein [Exilibacterium tricleocarpae]TQV84663.1 hypothetical protein FKG94_03835 [Exilibacterium tricleocarpae]
MNYQSWQQLRGRIKSKKGMWRIGAGVESHGYDLINELVGHYSYMQVVVLNATGRMPSKGLADWFEAVHICLSWPDPRIWCNRIGALGGASGASVVAATSAGIMASDSRAYGIRPIVEGIEFIQRARREVSAPALSAAEFVAREVKKHNGKPYLMGYARPVAKGDERIPALERVARQHHFETGPHLRLAYEIEALLSAQFDESMNINGYVSAFLSDLDFSAQEVYRIFSAVVFSGITACYVDTADREPGHFAPLQVADIEYTGKEDRELG